jgi:hypothetical protein
VDESGRKHDCFPDDFMWSDVAMNLSRELVEKVADSAGDALVIASIFWPMRQYKIEIKKGKNVLLVDFILHNSCRQPVKMIEAASSVLTAATRFEKLLDSGKLDVVDLGYVVFDAKELWEDGCSLAMNARLGDEDHKESTDLFMIIKQSGLDGVWEWKPFFNGKMLMQELGIKGPQVGEYVKRQLEWRFRHPKGSSEECLDSLKNGSGTK